ncbi:MAG: hypothetical protein P9M06_07535 [Candidatus Saelkia tenebricola]|nr:hypothetical protein [Candidatus Saelkia tenebricola]
MENPDLSGSYWIQWFIKKCITELNFSQLWHTDFVAYPHGMDLLSDFGPPFWECISIPFQLILPFPTSYTVLVLFILFLNAFLFFLFAKFLYKNTSLAFLAGILGSINPYTIHHVNAGRLQQMAIFWIPLFMLYLLKTKQQPNIKNTIITSILLILTTLSYWYYGMFLIIFMFLFLFYSYFLHATKREKLILTKNICLVLFFFGLSILLLFGYPVIVKGLYPRGYSAIRPFPSFQEIVSKNTPNYFSFMISGTSLKRLVNSSLIIAITNLLFLFNIKSLKKNLLWIISANIFYLLSLGPYLNIFGTIVPSFTFIFFYYLPTFLRLWWPINYFSMSISCSIIILISFINGLTYHKRIKTILSSFISLVFILLTYGNQHEFLPSSTLSFENLRFRFSQIKEPHSAYCYLKNQEATAIIELPLNWGSTLFLDNQMVHQKRTFNFPGYGFGEEIFIWPEKQVQLLKENLFLRYVDEACKHYSHTPVKKVISQQYTPQGIKKALEELHNLGFNYIVVNPEYTFRYLGKENLLIDLIRFFPVPFKEYYDGLKLYRIDNLIEDS